MPYVKGDSLREKLSREGELPIADAVRILKEVVDALAKAHSENVVHAYLKSQIVSIYMLQSSAYCRLPSALFRYMPSRAYLVCCQPSSILEALTCR